METNSIVQVDEYLKNSNKGEFLTLEEFDESWFEGVQEDILRSQTSQELVQSEEYKVVIARHEDCPPNKIKAHEAYTSLQSCINWSQMHPKNNWTKHDCT